MAPPSLAERKGDSIRIKTEKYKECDAWKDTWKTTTSKMIYVIVETEQGLISTRLNKDSIGSAFGIPASYEEAALQQHPDVDRKLDDLVKQLAMFDIDSSGDIMRIFAGRLDEAAAKHVAKGSNAPIRRVLWDASEANDNSNTV